MLIENKETKSLNVPKGGTISKQKAKFMKYLKKLSLDINLCLEKNSFWSKMTKILKSVSSLEP